MRPSSEIRVDLQRLEFSGQARGRHGNRLVYAWGGLAGENVTARVTRRKRNSLSCVVSEVHTPSADRVAPCESHYLSCSPWQMLEESRESHYKMQLVRDLFARRFATELPEFEVAGGAHYGYRNKLEFSFTDTPEGLSLAFYERESYRHKWPLEGCLLGSAAINQAAGHVCRILREQGTSSAALKSLVVRSSGKGQVAAALYVTEPIAPIADRVRELGFVSGMRVFYSNPQSPASVADEQLEDRGSPVLEEEVLGRQLQYSDRSFFQVNLPLYEQAIRRIEQFIEGSDLVYDLYAGVGTIGICLGARQTVFVESDQESVEFLRLNCDRNGVTPMEILAAPAEKALESIPSQATVVLDPPRAGVHPRLLKRLLAGAPQRIIYLSCNPQTQAQDLTVLQPHYELIHFGGYNFFPRTPRVETLAVLDRRLPAA